MARTYFTAAALVLSLAVSSSASAEYFPSDRERAQPAPPADQWDYVNQPMEHDRGFYLRGTLAPAWFVSRTPRAWPGVPGSGLRIEGGGVEVGLAIGGVVAPNVILHGTATGLFAPSPRVVSDYVSSSARDTSVVLLGFGPGITGYLPWNVYGTMSFGGVVAKYDFERDDLIAPDSGYGLFFEMAVGKEWWVGASTGLGIFGRLTTHRVTTDYPDAFGGVTLSTGLTVSFN